MNLYLLVILFSYLTNVRFSWQLEDYTDGRTELYWWQGPNSPFRPGAAQTVGVTSSVARPVVSAKKCKCAAKSKLNQIRQHIQQLNLLEEELKTKLEVNDQTGTRSIISKLNRQVLPSLSELIAANAEMLRQSGFRREFTVLETKQKAAVSRILYKSGVLETCNEFQAFYDVTGRCENLPIRPYVEDSQNGPCTFKKQEFYVAADDDSQTGKCSCPRYSDEDFLFYNEDDDGCYYPYEQGFCEVGEWIVKRNGELLCEDVPENCPNDGFHVYEIREAHSSQPKCYRTNRFYFDGPDLTNSPLNYSLCEGEEHVIGASLIAIHGTCYAENTQGFCRDGEWMVMREKLTGRGVRVSRPKRNKRYLVCEQVPVNCPADGYHVYMPARTRAGLSRPYCFGLGVRGPCPKLFRLDRHDEVDELWCRSTLSDIPDVWTPYTSVHLRIG